MFKKIFIYCLKVWLSAVILGPALFFIPGDPTNDSSMGFWEYMMFACVAGLIYSLVSFLLFCAGVAYFTSLHISIALQKILTTGWSVLLTIAPFPILFGKNHPNWIILSELSGCYLLPILIGIWIYRFPQKALMVQAAD